MFPCNTIALIHAEASKILFNVLSQNSAVILIALSSCAAPVLVVAAYLLLSVFASCRKDLDKFMLSLAAFPTRAYFVHPATQFLN